MTAVEAELGHLMGHERSAIAAHFGRADGPNTVWVTAGTESALDRTNPTAVSRALTLVAGWRRCERVAVANAVARASRAALCKRGGEEGVDDGGVEAMEACQRRPESAGYCRKKFWRRAPAPVLVGIPKMRCAVKNLFFSLCSLLFFPFHEGVP